MECCYDDCGEFSVTPVLMAPCYTSKCCDEPPICYPCLPRCHKPAIAYCEKKKSRRHDDDDDCCDGCDRKRGPSPPRHKRAPTSQSATNCCHPPNCCPTCCQPTCKPVRTKYVIPCYRYEDGRIERYVPTRYGRLPMSAYRRNGMQDQIHGYRGAVRYLCAGEGSQGPCVYTAVEPLRRLYPKVTQEVNPVKKKKDKK
ncbi:keratin-associated protein 9-1 [Manduca sexta]|uniref:keratin-associated protein 9-1 n=1 Tax=Manduca sexta TaxID=7130 RepID=UPI00188DCF0F|nr:keratin-associated protein 9-1 [Manduca sexta]